MPERERERVKRLGFFSPMSNGFFVSVCLCENYNKRFVCKWASRWDFCTSTKCGIPLFLISKVSCPLENLFLEAITNEPQLEQVRNDGPSICLMQISRSVWRNKSSQKKKIDRQFSFFISLSCRESRKFLAVLCHLSAAAFLSLFFCCSVLRQIASKNADNPFNVF